MRDEGTSPVSRARMVDPVEENTCDGEKRVTTRSRRGTIHRDSARRLGARDSPGPYRSAQVRNDPGGGKRTADRVVSPQCSTGDFHPPTLPGTR